MGEQSSEKTGTAHRGTKRHHTKPAHIADMDVGKFHEGVLQDVKVWMMYLNADHEIVTWNRGAEEISGYSSEEVVGSHAIWQKIYPDSKYRKEIIRKIEKILSEKKALENLETAITTRTGQTRQILWNLRQIENEEGAVIGYLSVGIDITEKAEIKTKYQVLIENAPMAIVLIQDGRLIFANEIAEQLTGYPVAEMTGRIMTDFIHPEDRAMVLKHYQDRMAGRPAPKTYSFRVITRGGESRQAEVTVAKYHHEGNIITIDFLNDITDRNIAEERLKEREEIFHAIASAAQDAIIMSDDEDLITYWNPAAERIFGYQAEEVIGNSLHDLIAHPKHRQSDHQDLKHFHETGESPVIGTTNELTMLRKGGVEFPSELSVSRARIKGRWHAIGIVRDISERKEKELELQKLAAVVRHSSELISLVTQDGTIVFINEAGARMLGSEPEQVVGKNLKEFMPEHMMKAVETEIIPALVNEGHWEGELQYIALSGRQIDVHAIHFVIKDPETEEVKYMANVSLNITEQKKTQEALKASEERFRSLAENSSDLIIIADENRQTLYASPSIERILGYKPEELIGKEGLIYFDPINIPVFKEALEESGGAGIQEALELPFKRKNGTTAYVEITGTRYIEEGKEVGIQIIGRDVTLRKEAERQRNLLSAIVQNSYDGIIGLDLKGRILSWNEGAKRIYGYEKEEIVGKEISIIIPPDRIHELDNEIERYTAGEIIPTFETVRITKFGEQIDVAITLSPIRDEKGTITGASAIVRDITKEKKMARTMLAYIAEAAMRLKNPVEIVRDNLVQTLDSLEKGEIDSKDARMQITIQIKNAEQILFNLRELDQAIVGTFENMPDQFRKFLTR